MGTTFLIADCHFGDEDVIRVFHRPFATVADMDRVMTEKWNRTVGPDDTMIVVGDFTHQPADRTRPFSTLPGNKILLRGNHDRGGPEAGGDSMVLVYKGMALFLVHNPDHAPSGWDGWIVHGHRHGRGQDYPFIDGVKRTINVACELTGYTPVDLEWLVRLDLPTIGWMAAAEAKPGRQ